MTKKIEWPDPETRRAVERVEAKLRAVLDGMSPEEEAKFWASIPWPFRAGSRRQNCLKCGGPTPPAVDYCEVCA